MFDDVELAAMEPSEADPTPRAADAPAGALWTCENEREWCGVCALCADRAMREAEHDVDTTGDCVPECEACQTEHVATPRPAPAPPAAKWWSHGSTSVWRPRPWLTVTVERTGPGLVGNAPRWFWHTEPVLLGLGRGDYAAAEDAQRAAEAAVRAEITAAYHEVSHG